MFCLVSFMPARSEDASKGIHDFTSEGDILSVYRFLQGGGDVDTRDSRGFTPLHQAIARDRLKVAHLLIKYGANVNAELRGATRPIDLAVFSGSRWILKILLDAGATIDDDVQRNSFSMSAFAGDLQAYMSAGSRLSSLVRDRTGWTPLHWAAAGNQSEIIAASISDKAMAARSSNYGRHSVLDIAVVFGSNEAFLVIIGSKQGAELIASRSIAGDTIFHTAILAKRDPFIEGLIEHGANVNSVNRLTKTPLHIAVRMGNQEACRMLLKHGAKTDLEDRHGNTPYAIALKHNFIGIIDLLADAEIGESIGP